MNNRLTLLFLAVSLALSVAQAQTPIVIVPAATAAPAKVAAPAAATPGAESSSLSATIKLLQEMKSANAETLKKQEAVLQQLDEVLKSAEQMKAFSKRG